MSKEIIVEFNHGEVKVSVNGVKGKACKDLTKKLEQELGKVQKDTPTSEMFESPLKQPLKVSQ